jgi:nitrous oxide reductase accessory protein NosL
MSSNNDSVKENRVYLKKIHLLLCLCVLSVYSLAAGFAEAAEQSCAYCGMYKSKFGHSWVILEHDDGSATGVCSIHCAAIDMALHTGKTIRKITVGDYNTQKQINADKAFWVIGGEIMGVMTARAKWAFETKAGADNFITHHGGRPATFSEVIKAAFEDMYQDTLMIRKKRRLINMRKNQSQ